MVINLSKKINEELTKLAEETGYSKVYHVRRAVKQYLEEKNEYNLKDYAIKELVNEKP